MKPAPPIVPAAAPVPRPSGLALPASPPPPVAAPVIPMAAPVDADEAAAASLSFDSEPDVVLRTPRRKAGIPGWLTAALLLVFIFGGTALLVIGAIRWQPHLFAPQQATGFIPQANLDMVPPPKPWQQDTALMAAMRVNLAYRRGDPSSVMALAFKDYQKRLPREAEMIDEALSKLRSYLGSVEYELQPKSDDVKLAGLPALQLNFTGENPEHVQVSGQCLMAASGGIGYWFFSWAPVDNQDQVSGEWAAFGGNLKLGKRREGWTEAPRAPLELTGVKLPYKLEYAKELWEKQPLDGYDKHDDAVLLGYDPKDKDARRGDQAALVQILALDKAPNLDAAAKEARDYLLEMEKEKQSGPGAMYNFPDAIVTVAAEKSLHNTDVATHIGGFRGHLFKLQVQKSADARKYVVMAVVNMEGDGVLAVACECDWGRRDYWDREFMALLDKLKPTKGK